MHCPKNFFCVAYQPHRYCVVWRTRNPIYTVDFVLFVFIHSVLKRKQAKHCRMPPKKAATKVVGDRKRNRDADATSEEDPTKATKRTSPARKQKAPPAPTISAFNLLLRRGDPSVSWVGNYTTTHQTHIEIGFLKKEAMALTTLLCCYREDGNGATSCPVAMVSGPGSFGRKLAIHHVSGQRTTMNYYRAGGERVKLNVGWNLDRQGGEIWGRFGRADVFFQCLEGALKRGLRIKNKIVFPVTETNRLKMPSSVDPIGGKTGLSDKDVSEFLYEVVLGNQCDVMRLLLRHLELHGRAPIRTAAVNGHLQMMKLLLGMWSDTPGTKENLTLNQNELASILDSVVRSENFNPEVLQFLVGELGADVNKDGVFASRLFARTAWNARPLRRAVDADNPGAVRKLLALGAEQ